ncbi:MAG: SpoIIE family protein phosphatase [Bacteroidales bacterium]|nr:SpoIIE family protein phosphatase [Bacteroidales bacterium]
MSHSKKDTLNDINIRFEKQKKELTESLKYASYIQKAILPTENQLKKYFPEHFLLYLPRDIVSGDFYWMARRNDRLFLAVADCTGHGVPGAFLSILGISVLNQIVGRSDCTSASGVLNTLREHIMKSLNQTGEESEQKDGIDMALCIIEPQKNILQFSGAFNPMYVIKNSNRLIEIPGDKMPIGVGAEEETSFTNHIVNIDEGDMIYLFSDGFADQFGGPKGKKFKYRPFRNLLLNINSMPMHSQKKELKESVEKWKGRIPQLDDILIFGMRYHK